jgi:hypothetical protein
MTILVAAPITLWSVADTEAQSVAVGPLTPAMPLVADGVQRVGSVEDPAEWFTAIHPVILHWLPLRDLTCPGSLGKSFLQTRPLLFCRRCAAYFPIPFRVTTKTTRAAEMTSSTGAAAGEDSAEDALVPRAPLAGV